MTVAYIGALIPRPLVDDVAQRLAGDVALQVVDEDVDASMAGERGGRAVVRRDDRVRGGPERAIRRQWLVPVRVETPVAP